MGDSLDLRFLKVSLRFGLPVIRVLRDTATRRQHRMEARCERADDSEAVGCDLHALCVASLCHLNRVCLLPLLAAARACVVLLPVVRLHLLSVVAACCTALQWTTTSSSGWMRGGGSCWSYRVCCGTGCATGGCFQWSL